MMEVAGISFEPLIGWTPVWVLAALCLLLAGYALIRRARGAWLRTAAFAVLVLALANPRLTTEERRPLSDVAVVVVDETTSQGIGERQAQTQAALAEVERRLAEQPNLEVRVERVTDAPGGEGTQAFAALDRALADVPRRRLAGAIMITDGLVHDVPADKGKDIGAPVHTLLTGRPGEIDRRLVVLGSPSFALVGRPTPIRLKVEEPGAQGSAKVEVRVDGNPYLTADIPLNRETSVDVPIRHGGPVVVELAAEPGEHELSLANNRAALSISGVRDRLKVLLISGEPHPGERNWRSLLKSDPAVDLVHFTILRPPEKDDATPVRELSLITFPVRELFEDKLSDFDLVVLDRFRRPEVLADTYYRSLARYVRDGGALLAAVGPEYGDPAGLAATPLAELLPVEPTGAVLNQAFRPVITDMGRRHPVTSGLSGASQSDAPPPWGRWLRQVAVRQKSGVTVMTGLDGRPLLILDRVGDGRVATILSDTIWLWARGWEGGGPYNELLRRLSHWLMQEPGLEEESLSAEIKQGRLEVTRHSLTPPAADAGKGSIDLTVTRPDQTTFTVKARDQGDGRATAQVPVDQPGLWRVSDGSRTAAAALGTTATLEMDEIAATAARLSPVAGVTGGSVTWLAEKGVPQIRRTAEGKSASGSGWIGLVSRDDHVVVGARETGLLPGLAVLALTAGFLLAAWWREGR